MKYTFEKAEKSTVKITIKLTEKEWKGAIDKAYEKTKSRYSMPGFRKGKVPKHLLESTYGTGLFYEDAINIAFPEYYGEVLDKEPSIAVIAQPEIDIKAISEKGITIEAVVAVKPEVKLGSYKGITFEKKVYNVTDEDVNADIARLQERNSRMVEVTDRPVADGDTVIIDYSGSVDGVKFEGGTAEKQRLELGSNSFIPGFEDQVCGMSIGEEKDINVTFPEDYHAEELKGKASVFAIKLHEIIVKELPELNDEFIKEATGEESLEAYRQKTRENLQKANDKRAKDQTEDKLLTAISDTTEVDIPDVLVESEITNMLQQFKYRLMYQGLQFEKYLEVTGQTEEQLKEQYREDALKRVKKQLVVGKIIELENIEATQEEVDAKIDEQAKSVSKEPEEYRKTMDERQVEYIRNTIVVDKLFDFLTANNEIA